MAPSRLRYLFIFIGISLILLIFNLTKLHHQCLSVIDYSIYQQAISELARFESWNPYITIRNIFIFNEHFDPIIYLAVPFFKLFNFSAYSLIIFEWLWFLTFVMLCFFEVKPKNNRELILLITLLFGLRAVLSAIAFVGHPVTWAMVPLFFLVKGIVKSKFKYVFLASLSLVIFKETFQFGVFGLSFFYLIKKQRKEFIALFILGLFFIIFEMKLRKMILGNTFSYGNSYLGDILRDPYNQIIYLFKEFHYADFFKVFYPFIIPVVIILKKFKNSKIHNNPAVGVFFFLIPLIGIYFIINRFSFHHASKFSVVLISLVIFTQTIEQLAKKKSLFIITSIVFVLSGISWHKKIFKLLVLSESSKCEPREERVSERKLLLNKFEEVSPSDHVFVTGGIGPFLVKPNLKLYHSSFSKFPSHFDYLVFEHGTHSDAYPLNLWEIKEMINDCVKEPHQSLFEGKYFTFLKGKFDSRCVRRRR